MKDSKYKREKPTGLVHRRNPVGWLTQKGLILFLLVTSLQAEPHVIGFERFHSAEASVEGGAILFSELGCANCHGDSPVKVERKGPKLVDLSQRVEREWLREFLRNPENGRKGSTMPSMLHGMSDENLGDILAFLGTVKKGIKFRAGRHANAERGSAIYHEKGCVACHAPTADYRGPHGSGNDFDTSLAIAHPDLQAKTSLEALNLFLSSPSKYRPDSRMPHIQLEPQEAIDVAAHLLDIQASDPRELPGVGEWPESTVEEAARGKALVQKMNCAACHEIPGLKPDGVKEIKGDGAHHCLSKEKVEGLPFYNLTDLQRESLLLFLQKKDGFEADGAHLTLAALNCYACHDRDSVGGPTTAANPFFVGNEGLGDSGRLPPPLTGIGHKLKPEWLKGVLEGKAENRVRPYVKTQMPAYAAHAAGLTEWLEELDRPDDPQPIEDRADDRGVGRKLLGIQGGVNCITCHNWGEQKSLGIPAVDLSNLDKRLQPTWFRSYLLNPAEYRPGTLMPPLWPGGKSTLPDVLGGNTERQIGAIWNFIEDGEGIPEGFPDRSGGQFELVPEDHPVIQRTFFNKSGTKAILVGFPGDIHLAFDGQKGRPALIWRGAFFDAYDTWFTRAAPFGDPLSEDVYPFPEAEKAGRFRGYELDADGNPTFIVSREGREIREKFSVTDRKMVRVITWSDGQAPDVSHPEGVETIVEGVDDRLTFTYFWK